MKNINLMILLCIAIAFGGCAKKAPKDSKVLVTFGNQSISIDEFNAKIEKLPPYYRSVIDKNKMRYLEEIILEMMFYEEAVRGQIDRSREIQDLMKEAKKKIIIAKYLKTELDDKLKVGEEEMRAFYDAHKDEFKTPELWRASHILVADEKSARDILDELSKGASFEELAKARSTDATAARGGDVGYFRTGQLVPEFEKVCLNLPVGRTSDIVQTQFGYHIIKLTEKRPPAAREYNDVKGAIEAELKKRKRAERFDQLVSELKDKYGVSIKDDAPQAMGITETVQAEETEAK